MSRPLANLRGIGLVLALLLTAGAVCPACGHGTRVTSKRWAKCKKCGAKVKRVHLADITPASEAHGE